MPVLHDKSRELKAKALGAETADAEAVGKKLADAGLTDAEIQKCLAALGLAAGGAMSQQPIVPAGPQGEPLPIGNPSVVPKRADGAPVVPTSPTGGPDTPKVSAFSAGPDGRKVLPADSPMLKALRVTNPRCYERLTGKHA